MLALTGDRARGRTGDAASPIRQRMAGGGVLVATAVAVLLPWVVPNLVRFERPVLLSTNDGTTLLGSYCDASFFGPNKGGWTIECVFEHPTYDIDVDATVRGPRQREAAFDYAKDHLGDAPEGRRRAHPAHGRPVRHRRTPRVRRRRRAAALGGVDRHRELVDPRPARHRRLVPAPRTIEVAVRRAGRRRCSPSPRCSTAATGSARRSNRSSCCARPSRWSRHGT